MFVGGQVFQIVDISGREWGISLALGFMALPIGFLMRCIPNEPIERLLIWLGLHSDPNRLPTKSAEAEELDWNPAVNDIRDDLAVIANNRGSRFKTLTLALKNFRNRKQRSEVNL